MKSMHGVAAVLVSAAVALALSACHGDNTRKGLGAFTANPEALSFGAVALGRDRVVEITLTNESRIPYNVTEVTPTVPNVEVLDFEGLNLGAGESKTLKVRFAPEAEGQVTGALDIVTDDANAGGTLPFDGRGVKAFATVAEQALDFGQVDIDTVKVMEVNVTNTTAVEAPLRFAFEGDNAQQFSSADASQDLVLQPGEARVLHVAFKPVLVGLAEATAVFQVCPSCEPVRVALTGEGITGAVEIYPTRVDFGRVSLGASISQTVTLTNRGTKDVTLKGAWLDPTSQADGIVSLTAPVGLPKILAANASETVTLTFSPKETATLQGRWVQVDYVLDGQEWTPKLGILGEGGASCVTLLPRAVDFGTVPEGMTATRRVDVFNRCSYDVQVLDAKAVATSGGYFSLGQMATMVVVPAGTYSSLNVSYTPKPGVNQAQGQLTVKVQEQSATSVVQIPLMGASKVFQPCTWSLLPQSVDFGAVPMGAAVTLGVTLQNSGADECFLGGMQLAAGSDAEFTATPVTSTVLKPGENAVLKVTFRPNAQGSYAGLAEGWVNHPTNNHPTAVLTGQGVKGCFTLQPTDVDFGVSKLSCGARTRTVIGYNKCAAAVNVTGVLLDSPASTEFSMTPKSAPFQIPAGGQTTFTLQYLPTDDGDDTAALRVTADGVSYTAGLVGQGLTKPTKTDVFTQDSQAKVDVLFVIDNSGSMMEEQQSLGQNFAAFLSAAQAGGIDYQIGVTTTGIEASPGGWSICPGGADGGEAGRLFPVNGATPRIITPTTANAAQVFASNVNVGWCHWNEQGLEAAYRALSTPLVNSADDPNTPQPNDGNAGFLRPDAKLAVVFVSDEDDSSVQPLSFYETFFKSLKTDASQLSMSAIVGPAQLSTCPTASSSGSRYMSLANGTGGVVESICTKDWAASLAKISSNTFGPKRAFKLSETPADATQIVVEVNGQPVTAGWTYDANTNSVVFDEQNAPGSGSVIEITYPLGC